MKSSQNLLKMLKERRLMLDGGTGTVLLSMGLSAGEAPESWCFTHPDRIEKLHLSYMRAGSDIICTNSFGVNSLKYENYEEYIARAVEIAKGAREKFYDGGGIGERFIALDIGPTGKMLRPLGDLAFEEAVEVFGKSVRAGVKAGCDLIFIETMNDSYETKAAVLAAKENSELPVFVSNVYDGSCKLMTGASPEAMVAMLEGLGVDAIGANCSLGPDKLIPTLKRLVSAASVPVIFKPNAGLPSVLNGESVFDIDSEGFSNLMAECAQIGASLLGGCCGTTPEYIRKTAEKIKDIPYTPTEEKHYTAVSSYTHALRIGDGPVLIGERINPTGKPKLREALRSENISHILKEAISEEEAGAHMLDVNVGIPEIDEAEAMRRAVTEIQVVCSLPLQIDSGKPEALSAAMRVYNGKPLVNSVNGKAEVMSAVFPLVKKYGGAVIALTMDENGIPDTVEGRVAIAEKIAAEAEKYGIGKKNLIFDPLAMAVSSDKNAASVTLGAVSELHKRGYLTSLGVSNVSFGLPAREKLNAAFFSMALSKGLDAAIINPHSRSMMDIYRSYMALSGLDDGFSHYIEYADANGSDGAVLLPSVKKSENDGEKSLSHAIASGISDEAKGLCEELISKASPLDIINNEIIPALDSVGAKFEKGLIYLPALLKSAEAASAAFSVVKSQMTPVSRDKNLNKIVLATVEGDIHDIGKNIVKLLLESHGYTVVDLGKDVPTEKIVEEALREGARLVGLSALMTTTVPAMEKTIALIREKLPDASVMVGGAVLTAEYAMTIGADFYAKDGMEAVKIAREFFEKKSPKN